jgi:hypothetical protein
LFLSCCAPPAAARRKKEGAGAFRVPEKFGMDSYLEALQSKTSLVRQEAIYDAFHRLLDDATFIGIAFK